MINEQEIVRSVFDAYIRDTKANSTKKDRPTFDMLEEVKNMAINALEQQSSDYCVDINHVIATISQHHFDKDKDNFDLLIHNLCKEVKALPPVTPTIPSSDDCISRQAVIDMTGLSNWFESSDDYNSFVEDLCKLPPVTPTQCIAAVRFSKEDLREICNERIEIECTHGTCKDCHNAVKNYSNGRIYCLFSNCIYDEDFYCKEFNRRGNENG